VVSTTVAKIRNTGCGASLGTSIRRTTQSTRAPIVFPKSIGDLLRLSGDDLVEVDIGLCNLICAEGLRGSENLDIPSTLGRLDEMAEAVRVSTASLWKKFERSPGD
jgi:hypothetical protein